MRIGILQFAPQLATREKNIARANEILDGPWVISSKDYTEDAVDAGKSVQDGRKLDLLVLPELAFSGYNFPSSSAIAPYLEPTAAGPSARWAARTASRLGCLVAVGYPETTTDPQRIPGHVLESDQSDQADESQRDDTAQNYNSLVVVGPDATVLAHYRKTHLYYTDATWAQPSPTGWQVAKLPLAQSASVIHTAFAICMDINPQYFTAPWDAYEVANFVRDQRVPVLLTSMAWLSGQSPSESPEEPNMEVMAYWLERLTPLLDHPGTDERSQVHNLNQDPNSSRGHFIGDHDKGNTLVIFANRTGTEAGECRACELDPTVRQARGTIAPPNEEHPPTKQDAAHAEVTAASAPGAEPIAAQPTAVTQETDLDHSSNDDLAARRAAYLASNPVVSSDAQYAGTSSVMLLGHGKAQVLGMLGKGDERVLFVDTSDPPVAVYSLSRKNGDREKMNA